MSASRARASRAQSAILREREALVRIAGGQGESQFEVENQTKSRLQAKGAHFFLARRIFLKHVSIDSPEDSAPGNIFSFL